MSYNPYFKTRDDVLNLTPESQGRHGWAYLHLSVAGALDSTPTSSSDAAAEVLSRTAATLDRESFGFKYLSDLLTPYTVANKG